MRVAMLVASQYRSTRRTPRRCLWLTLRHLFMLTCQTCRAQCEGDYTKFFFKDGTQLLVCGSCCRAWEACNRMLAEKDDQLNLILPPDGLNVLAEFALRDKLIRFYSERKVYPGLPGVTVNDQLF